MNSESLKKLIIALVILLIIITIVIISIYNIGIKNEGNEEMTEDGEDVLASYGKSTSEGIDYQSYFDVKACMQKYIDNINIKNSKYYLYDKTNGTVTVTEESEIKQNIYNLLSDKFINEKNITIGNLYDNVKTLQKAATYLPVEATLIQEGDIKSFLVYGLIQSTEDYSVMDKLFAVVNINIIDAKFSIEPIYGDYTSISEIKIQKLEETITANEGNRFIMSYTTPEQYPTEYINIYKGLALGAPEKLYNLLDEEYKNARFGTLDEFKNYIEKNKEEIRSTRLDKYKIDVGEEDVRYVCLDQYEKYYVINQKSLLQDYTMMLDTYTIDLPEFIEKYESSEDNIKVALNVEKLIEATKMGDYKYVYNKLDETFRANNFKTVENFEKFIKGKFDAQEDTIEYKNYEKASGVHIYNIIVTDKSENREIKAKVIMDLKDNRDFVLSFSAE